MKKNHQGNLTRRAIGLAAIAAAVAAATPVTFGGTSSGTGSGGTAVTISLSGSTAMSNFTRSAGFSLLNPGSEIDLLSGPAGAPVRYKAASGATTSMQLGANNFTSGVTANPAGAGTPIGVGDPAVGGTTNYAALRIEWHESGSVEGIFELADSQIDDSIYANTTYNGTAATGTYVNQNKFGGTTPNTAWNAPALASVNGFDISTFANANDRTTAQTQNRVQMAISDVNAVQGFSRVGTGTFNATPGSAGYGKGNPALVAAPNLSGIGVAKGRQQLIDEVALNMTTSTIDPATDPGDVGAAGGSGTNYASGPWNSAGVKNLHNEKVAVTATSLAANPGTGLVRLNKTDAQWLQAAGRLQNGADFNVATRDVNSGTRNVGALNVGLDASWASGENDDGSGGGGTQDTINAAGGIRFSNKASGGSNLRPTIQNSRMALGTLGLSDYRNSAGGANNGSRPLRALDYRNDLVDGGIPGTVTTTVGSKTFVVTREGFTPVNAYNIVNGNYALFQNQTYVTVKDMTQGATAISQFITDYTTNEGVAPTAQQQQDLWSGTTINGGGGRKYLLNDNPAVQTVAGLITTYGTGIKGDSKNVLSGTDYGHDVYDVRKNILDSVNTFPPTSTASPADNLLNQSFILPQFMVVNKETDGGSLSANPTYNAGLSNTFLGGSTLANNFDVNGTTGSTLALIKGPADATKGASASIYGNITPAQGAINITDPGTTGTDGNWLFGNFNQNGIRDFAAVKAAADAQIALQTDGDGISMFADSSNNSGITGLSATLNAMTGHDGTAQAKKGDLIVMGDYDSDGDFDGKDLYLLARGAALADNTGTDQLTAASGADFGDRVRKGVLRKNAALDHMAGLFSASSVQAVAASANITNDPTGANAFNKRDVNRDGNVDFVDAVTSDKFFNQNYTDLAQVLAATGDVRLGGVPTPISLVDMELTDTGNIDQTDLDVINTALIGTGKETWTGTLLKTGAGTVSTAYTGGTFKVNTAAGLKIDAGTVNVGGSADPFTDNTGSGTNGNHLAIENNSTTSLNITAGSKAIAALSGVGNTSVSAGAAMTADSIRQNALTVNGNATVRANGLASGVSKVTTLNIAGSGKLDLTNNKLITNDPAGTQTGGIYNGVQGLVQSGYNGGAWNGTTGVITSQSDATNGSALTTIGVSTGALARFLSPTDTDLWAGQTIDGNSTLAMYTYIGDANLDGFLDGTDYFYIDNGASTPGADGFANGDFNYDGAIDATDYFYIDNGIAPGLPQIYVSGGSELLAGAAAVPEPGSAGFILAATGYSLARTSRRRRR